MAEYAFDIASVTVPSVVRRNRFQRGCDIFVSPVGDCWIFRGGCVEVRDWAGQLKAGVNSQSFSKDFVSYARKCERLLFRPSGAPVLCFSNCIIAFDKNLRNRKVLLACQPREYIKDAKANASGVHVLMSTPARDMIWLGLGGSHPAKYPFARVQFLAVSATHYFMMFKAKRKWMILVCVYPFESLSCLVRRWIGTVGQLTHASQCQTLLAIVSASCCCCFGSRPKLDCNQFWPWADPNRLMLFWTKLAA